MSCNIAHIIGSFKPIHRGHWKLIQQAAADCDYLMLYASTADRGIVRGIHMEHIWVMHLRQLLPLNVRLFLAHNPMRTFYENLGQVNKSTDTDVHFIYTAQDDSSNFAVDSMSRYFNRLYSSDLLKIKCFERSDLFDISSTTMRRLIQTNQYDEFLANLPACVDGNFIWNVLTGGV